MLAEQAEEQRRRVDGAVVARERREPEPRDLARAQFVQHLAGLLVVVGVVARADQAGQHAQRLLRHRRVEREHLRRRDQRVAAEQRRVPRHPGGVVAVGAEPRMQHPHVEQRAPQQRG